MANPVTAYGIRVKRKQPDRSVRLHVLTGKCLLSGKFVCDVINEVVDFAFAEFDATLT